jgi:hypothetical protein
MEDAVKKARADGAMVIFVSGGRGLYRRMGCVNAGLFRLVTVQGEFHVPNLHATVREWTPADLPEMIALHQAEAVRFMRDPAEMRTLLDSGFLFCRPARTWVVRNDERLLTYLCAGQPFDRSEKGRLLVKEIAGSRAAVLGAIPTIMRADSANRVEIDTTGNDVELCALAQMHFLPVSALGFRGTLKVVDRAGLFRALEGHIAERLTPAELGSFKVTCDGPVAFEHAGERFVIDKDGELAALLFGSLEEAVPRIEGRLGEILARLFPLPLPCYGLNYI